MRSLIAVAIATMLTSSCLPDPETTVGTDSAETTTVDHVAHGTMAETATVAPVADAGDGTQTIHVGGQFSPSSITVKAGEPIRLAFHRTDEPSCGDEVVFPALGIRKALPKNETTIVDLPAQASATTLQFACGMDMMKGQIVVQ